MKKMCFQVGLKKKLKLKKPRIHAELRQDLSW